MKLTKEDIVRARCDVDMHAEDLAKMFASVFIANGWTWSWLLPGGMRVPNEADIELELRVLASNLYDGHERSFCAGGRLEILVTKSNTGWVTTEVQVAMKKTISVRHEEEEERRRGQ